MDHVRWVIINFLLILFNMHNNSHHQSKVSLKKAQTHIAKVLKMIDEDEYCIDILQQLLAVNGLVKSASEKILKNHLEHCFSEGLKTNDEKRKAELIAEVLSVVDLGKRNK